MEEVMKDVFNCPHCGEQISMIVGIEDKEEEEDTEDSD